MEARFKIDFEAIGTVWYVDLFEQHHEIDNLRLRDKIFAYVWNFEKLYSRFIDESLLSKLNRENSLTNAPNELIEMVNYGEKLRVITNGAFSLGVGRVLNEKGYDKNYTFVPTKNESKSSRNFEVQVSRNRIQIPKDSAIDLGGLGKGYLIDRVSKLIKEDGFKEFTVNAGGDIYCEMNSPLKFYLENPFDRMEFIGSIELKKGSLACSSSNRREWVYKDRVYNHLIDMKTEESVKNILGVFTYSENALAADAGSTAIFVSESNLWDKIAESLSIEYLVIFADRRYIKSKGYPGRLN